MARNQNHSENIKDILQHVEPLPDTAKSPYLHYWQAGNDIFGMLNYLAKKISQTRSQKPVAERHLSRVYTQSLVEVTEAFERYLKEVAAECVDCVLNCVLDERFNVFRLQGATLASHFGTATAGKALCESATWLECKEINDRFRTLLAEPFQVGDFYVFPKESNQQPKSEQWRYEVMSLVWQIRHTIVHNVGVITQSDAIRLRLLAKTTVQSPRLLKPTRKDVDYLKAFLDETVEECNPRIGQRLAALLTKLHADNPALFSPAEMANRVTDSFQVVLSVAGVNGTLQG